MRLRRPGDPRVDGSEIVDWNQWLVGSAADLRGWSLIWLDLAFSGLLPISVDHRQSGGSETEWGVSLRGLGIEFLSGCDHHLVADGARMNAGKTRPKGRVGLG